MTQKPRQPCDRLIPEDGPILIWPDGTAEQRGALLLDVNVCPFPGCPERHVIVDGFLVRDVRHDAPEPARRTVGRTLVESDPEWAFVVSVDVDPPGQVHVEKCRDGGALGRFTEALDEELRSALLRRFERQRAEFDTVLRTGAGPTVGSTVLGTLGGSGWSATPVAPGQLEAVLAGFERARRAREVPRSGPPPRGLARPATVGRNDPCPCGSGLKYKRCCLGSE